MISKLLEALEYCAKNPELRDNQLLGNAYELIKTLQAVPAMLQWLPYTYEKKALPEIPAPDEKDSLRDYRFKRLMVNGVRKIPYAENQYYGLNFTTESAPDEPVSSVYVGSNGVGKSSLYAAMERASLHHLYTAEARGCKDPELYFRHFQCTVDPEVLIDTPSGEIYYPSENREEGLPAFFCTEYDIWQMERKDFDNKDIDVQLGLDSLAAFIKLLEDFETLLGNLNAIQDIQKAINRLSSTKDEDKKARKDLKSQLKSHKESAIIIVGDAWQDLKYNSFTRIIKQTQCLKRELEDYYEGQIDQIQKQLELIVPELMSAYFKAEEGIVDIGGQGNPLSIMLKLNAGEGKDPVIMQPRIYFNTFRFKVYCVVLKIALACCAKILNHINYPIVIDDVFDSIDFSNRYNIHTFIRRIVEKHNKVVPDIPLQIIFLTQDSLVGENIFRGISKALCPVKYSRLYEFTHSKETDKHTIQVSSPDMRNVTYIQLEDPILIS
jgi:hypothetical protein